MIGAAVFLAFLAFVAAVVALRVAFEARTIANASMSITLQRHEALEGRVHVLARMVENMRFAAEHQVLVPLPAVAEALLRRLATITLEHQRREIRAAAGYSYSIEGELTERGRHVRLAESDCADIEILLLALGATAEPIPPQKQPLARGIYLREEQRPCA
jgi:hypothetical protein